LDKSTDTRERLNEATDFELMIKLGKLFHAETRRLKKSFANILVRHSGVYDKYGLIYIIFFCLHQIDGESPDLLPANYITDADVSIDIIIKGNIAKQFCMSCTCSSLLLLYCIFLKVNNGSILIGVY